MIQMMKVLDKINRSVNRSVIESLIITEDDFLKEADVVNASSFQVYNTK